MCVCVCVCVRVCTCVYHLWQAPIRPSPPPRWTDNTTLVSCDSLLQEYSLPVHWCSDALAAGACDSVPGCTFCSTHDTLTNTTAQSSCLPSASDVSTNSSSSSNAFTVANCTSAACTHRCTAYPTCNACAMDPECLWCATTSTCVAATTVVAAVNTSAICPPRPSPATNPALLTTVDECRVDARLSKAYGFSRFESERLRDEQYVLQNPLDPSWAFSSEVVAVVDEESKTRAPSSLLFLGTLVARESGEHVFAAANYDRKGFLWLWPADAQAWANVTTPAQAELLVDIRHTSGPRGDVVVSSPVTLQQGSLYRVALALNARGGVLRSAHVYWMPPSSSQLQLLPSQDTVVPFTSAAACTAFATCGSCLHSAGCMWCDGQCLSTSAGATDACRAAPLFEQQDCAACDSAQTCDECLQTPGSACVWDNQACVPLGSVDVSNSSVTDSSQCPVPCSERSGCGECVGGAGVDDDAGSCGYCESSGTCFALTTFVAAHAYGQCVAWKRASVLTASDCANCTAFASCDTCTSALGCGWCAHPVRTGKQ